MFVIKGSGIATELGEIAALIVLGLVKLAFVFVGANLFDQIGRRPLLFVSLCGMFPKKCCVRVSRPWRLPTLRNGGGFGDREHYLSIPVSCQ
jgi:hypothetical protein